MQITNEFNLPDTLTIEEYFNQNLDMVKDNTIHYLKYTLKDPNPTTPDIVEMDLELVKETFENGIVLTIDPQKIPNRKYTLWLGDFNTGHQFNLLESFNKARKFITDCNILIIQKVSDGYNLILFGLE
jgi:hypothetical protein